MQARSCWHDNKTGREEGSATSMLSNGVWPPPPSLGLFQGRTPGSCVHTVLDALRACWVPGHMWEGPSLNLRDLNMLQAFLFFFFFRHSFFNAFIYFWLCWVFAAARAFL